jgi:hypothetical protein
MVRVRWCITEVKGTVPFPLTLFTMHNTNGKTDDLQSIGVF